MCSRVGTHATHMEMLRDINSACKKNSNACKRHESCNKQPSKLRTERNTNKNCQTTKQTMVRNLRMCTQCKWDCKSILRIACTCHHLSRTMLQHVAEPASLTQHQHAPMKQQMRTQIAKQTNLRSNNMCTNALAHSSHSKAACLESKGAIGHSTTSALPVTMHTSAQMGHFSIFLHVSSI